MKKKNLKHFVWLNDDGSIDHNKPMSSGDWTENGHSGASYATYQKVAGTSFQAADHYVASSAGIDLERDQTVSPDSINYKLDKTGFKDEGACPSSSRAKVYIYIDLASLLVAPTAAYNGSIKIDFSNANSQ